ncbi:MAG: hypothetical protein JWM17_2171 [Actinobacteria bacterium]|nr:hypothetical protein [Actinomycetota bacterium]
MFARGWPGPAAALVAAMIILGGCSGGSPDARTSPSTVAATQSTALGVVVCPTTFGITSPSLPRLPTQLRTSVPAALAGRLSAYTDQAGTVFTIAPQGWQCAGAVAADGSSSVMVVPPGASTQPFPRGFTVDGREGVATSGTSACRGCTYDLVCPLLADAADAPLYPPCSHVPPPAESVTHPSATAVGFQDPPGVAGDGAPSGGAYPANGVIVFHPPTPNPDAETGFIETCTLPEADHALCTAALNDFLRRYE